MQLTKTQIQELAKLARLELSAAQVTKMQTEVSGILNYVEQLQKVPTQGVLPTNQVTDLENISRMDLVTNQPARDKMLASAPEVEAQHVKVKKVL